jgi:3'(2'), 5'-bisphosphate nucleotidase
MSLNRHLKGFEYCCVVYTATFEQRSKWQEYWLVDPLDGTQDFLEQTGEFCICIAYIKNHQAIFGLVYAPLTQTHYYGFDPAAVSHSQQGPNLG